MYPGYLLVVRKILQLGHGEILSTATTLRARSVEISEFDSSFKDIIQDLKDTLFSSSIAVGLAAPQIGINKRVAVINISRDRSGPTLVIANPRQITISGKKDLKKESCMSILTGEAQ
jgi:peptide deformylase